MISSLFHGIWYTCVRSMNRSFPSSFSISLLMATHSWSLLDGRRAWGYNCLHDRNTTYQTCFFCTSWTRSRSPLLYHVWWIIGLLSCKSPSRNSNSPWLLLGTSQFNIIWQYPCNFVLCHQNRASHSSSWYETGRILWLGSAWMGPRFKYIPYGMMICAIGNLVDQRRLLLHACSWPSQAQMTDWCVTSLYVCHPWWSFCSSSFGEGKFYHGKEFLKGPIKTFNRTLLLISIVSPIWSNQLFDIYVFLFKIHRGKRFGLVFHLNTLLRLTLRL